MLWKNIRGTGDNKPPEGCTNYLEFYEKESGHTTKICKVKGCTNGVEMGAHVKKVKLRSNQDNSWYVIPMCKACNKRDDEFELNVDACPVEIRHVSQPTTAKKKPARK
jgi:hypothetical protein